MDVHCDLFFRVPPARLGIAPLTSMYWYGENQRDRAADWRPEIHDNDGLGDLERQGRAHLAAADQSAACCRPMRLPIQAPRASA